MFFVCKKKGYNIVQRYNKTVKNMNKNVFIIEKPMKAVGGGICRSSFQFATIGKNDSNYPVNEK